MCHLVQAGICSAAGAVVVAGVWKEGEVKGPAGSRQEVQLLEAAGGG